jgi:RNA polymerase sigma factor, sigma-70 family
MLILAFTYDEDGQLALTEIYEKHGELMLKVAMSYLSKEDAEDALHDIIERIGQKNKDDFSKLRDNKKGFFVVIARNHCLDVIRKNKSSASKVIPIEDDFIFVDSAPTPEALIEIKDDQEALTQLVIELKPGYREILEYKYMLGYSNGEIAKILHVTPSVVSTRLERARNKLKSIIEEKGLEK